MKHLNFFRISLFSNNSDYFCDLGFSQIQETNYFELKMLTLSVNKCCDFGTEKCFCFIRILIDFVVFCISEEFSFRLLRFFDVAFFLTNIVFEDFSWFSLNLASQILLDFIMKSFDPFGFHELRWSKSSWILNTAESSRNHDDVQHHCNTCCHLLCTKKIIKLL